jgi:hypothetical protein
MGRPSKSETTEVENVEVAEAPKPQPKTTKPLVGTGEGLKGFDLFQLQVNRDMARGTYSVTVFNRITLNQKMHPEMIPQMNMLQDHQNVTAHGNKPLISYWVETGSIKSGESYEAKDLIEHKMGRTYVIGLEIDWTKKISN